MTGLVCSKRSSLRACESCLRSGSGWMLILSLPPQREGRKEGDVQPLWSSIGRKLCVVANSVNRYNRIVSGARNPRVCISRSRQTLSVCSRLGNVNLAFLDKVRLRSKRQLVRSTSSARPSIAQVLKADIHDFGLGIEHRSLKGASICGSYCKATLPLYIMQPGLTHVRYQPQSSALESSSLYTGASRGDSSANTYDSCYSMTSLSLF